MNTIQIQIFSIQLLSFYRFKKSLFQTRLSRLKKKSVKNGWSSSGKQNCSKFATGENIFHKSLPTERNIRMEEGCIW